MTILVFGQNGQVATELARQSGEVLCLDRAAADLSDPAACAAAIETHRPRAVINAAAWTAVDQAEAHEAEAQVINGAAPAAMARACAAQGIPLVHISTDYVFAGHGTDPWRETDPVNPQNAYGRTKLAGEAGVCAAGGAHVILRTSWVVSAHGGNFVKTMLRLGAAHDRLPIVADQVGGPTPAGDIARACLGIADQLIADPGKSGTYHLSGGPDVSWADFARAIFDLAGLDCAVEDITTDTFNRGKDPQPAPRPANSRMDNRALTAAFGIARPAWRASLTAILTELGART